MNPLSRNNPLWKRICVILGSCLLLAALGLALGLGKLALMGRFSATMDMIKSNIRQF